MLIWNLSLLMKLLISIMLVKHTVAQINIKIRLQKRHPSNSDASSNQSVDSVKKIDYFDASALAGALTSPA